MCHCSGPEPLPASCSCMRTADTGLSAACLRQGRACALIFCRQWRRAQLSSPALRSLLARHESARAPSASGRPFGFWPDDPADNCPPSRPHRAGLQLKEQTNGNHRQLQTRSKRHLLRRNHHTRHLPQGSTGSDRGNGEKRPRPQGLRRPGRDRRGVAEIEPQRRCLLRGQARRPHLPRSGLGEPGRKPEGSRGLQPALGSARQRLSPRPDLEAALLLRQGAAIRAFLLWKASLYILSSREGLP